MAIPALFHPQVFYSYFLSKPVSPEQIAVAFIHRNYVFIFNTGADHFFFTPYTAPVRKFTSPVPVIKELHPLPCAFLLQFIHIVPYFKKVTAVWTVVNYLIQLMLL